MDIIKQIFVVFGLCLVGTVISGFIPLPIPGSVISMLLVLALLALGWLKEEKVSQLSQFLQKNMVFFFIPAGVGLIAELDVIKANLIALLVIGMVCTVITFVCTGGAVWLAQRLLKGRAQK